MFDKIDFIPKMSVILILGNILEKNKNIQSRMLNIEYGQNLVFELFEFFSR